MESVSKKQKITEILVVVYGQNTLRVSGIHLSQLVTKRFVHGNRLHSVVVAFTAGSL